MNELNDFENITDETEMYQFIESLLDSEENVSETDETDKDQCKNCNGFNLLKNDKLDKENNYFEIRSKRAKIIRSRSNFNFFAFHFSSKIMQNFRNLFLKFLVKRKFFVKRYLGKVYRN